MKRNAIAPARRARHSSVVLPPDLVAHPRERQMSRRTHGRAAHMSAADIHAKTWYLHGETVIAETAVFANVALQNCPLFPRAIYVDLLKQCDTCHRPFLFYANEQRFWFETLRIPVDADCVNCPPCRKRAHRVKGCLDRYAKTLHAPRLDAKAMKTFVDDTLFLLEEGLVRNLSRLGAIKNRAQRELAAYPGTQRLAQALARAHEAAEMRPGAWRNRHWAA